VRIDLDAGTEIERGREDRFRRREPWQQRLRRRNRAVPRAAAWSARARADVTRK
jgi:hypothetical protein